MATYPHVGSGGGYELKSDENIFDDPVVVSG